MPSNSMTVQQVRDWALEGARRVLRGRDDLAQDVAQEVSVRILKRLSDLDIDEKRLRSYVLTAGKRLAIDYLRGEARKKRILSAAGIPSTANMVDLRLDLRKALQRLSAEDRSLLRSLAYGYTNKELATSLGIDEGAARTRVHRARKRLLQQLKIQEKH